MSVNPEFVIDPKLLVQTMFGGNALLTFESKKTKDHRVFHIAKKKFSKEQNYYVRKQSILIATFKGMQLVFPNTQLTKDQEILQWIWKYITDPDYISRQLNIYHNGKCCVCGRKLTDPESIKIGIGPTCRTYK